VQLRVPLAEVRDVLGHASVVMTEHYAHLAPEGTRSALTKLADSASRSGHVIAFDDRRRSA
jgi:integrase